MKSIGFGGIKKEAEVRPDKVTGKDTVSVVLKITRLKKSCREAEDWHHVAVLGALKRDQMLLVKVRPQLWW